MEEEIPAILMMLRIDEIDAIVRDLLVERRDHEQTLKNIQSQESIETTS